MFCNSSKLRESDVTFANSFLSDLTVTFKQLHDSIIKISRPGAMESRKRTQRRPSFFADAPREKNYSRCLSQSFVYTDRIIESAYCGTSRHITELSEIIPALNSTRFYKQRDHDRLITLKYHTQRRFT